MGHILAIANQKGGVGKTTTVVNLGAALAERGQHVLLVDLDPQGALTAWCGLDPYTLTPTTYSLLTQDGVRLGQIVRPIGERLWLAPGSVDLAAAEYLLMNRPDRARRLADLLRAEADQVAYVLIDTPPSLGLLTVNALTAAEAVLVPVECRYLAMRGIRAILDSVGTVRERLTPALDLLGLLPTMYQPASTHSRQVVEELRSAFHERVFDTVIELDEALATAPAARLPVLLHRPESAAAAAYRRLASEVEARSTAASAAAG
ncbi:MAG: ParA family protein [Anaerolineales bacterium]|nr:ParA family protein [Anaerolineales bacterium]